VVLLCPRVGEDRRQRGLAAHLADLSEDAVVREGVQANEVRAKEHPFGSL